MLWGQLTTAVKFAFCFKFYSFNKENLSKLSKARHIKFTCKLRRIWTSSSCLSDRLQRSTLFSLTPIHVRASHVIGSCQSSTRTVTSFDFDTCNAPPPIPLFLNRQSRSLEVFLLATKFSCYLIKRLVFCRSHLSWRLGKGWMLRLVFMFLLRAAQATLRCATPEGNVNSVARFLEVFEQWEKHFVWCN